MDSSEGGTTRRALALALVVAAAFPVRIRYALLGFGSFTVFDLVLFAGSFLLLLRLLLCGKLRVGDRPTFFLLTIPALICVLSLAWSQNRGATLYRTVFATEAVLAYLVAINLFARLPAQRIVRYLGILVVLLILGGVLSLFGVPGFEAPTTGLEPGSDDYFNFVASYYSRFSHPFLGLSNNFATCLAFFVFLFAAYGAARRQRLPLALAVLAAAGVAATLSRGAGAAVVVSAVVFVIAVRRQVRISVPAIVVGLTMMFGLCYAFFAFSETAQQHLVDRMNQSTVEHRNRKMSIALDKIAQAPVLGYGGGVTPDNEPEMKNGVHNTYLQQVLDFGVPLGLAVSLSLLALPLRFLLWPSRRPAVRLMATGVGVSLLGQMIIYLSQSSFEGTLLRVFFYFSVALAVQLLRALEQEATAPAAAPVSTRRHRSLVTNHAC